MNVLRLLVADTSSSNIPLTKGQPRPGRLRKVFWNDLGLRAGWRFLIYVGLFGVLAFLLGTALDYFVKPGSGVFSNGLFLLMGFVCAIGAARIMSRIEKRPRLGYGLPTRGAFGKRFWQGWLAGLIEVSVVVSLIAAFHGYSFGRLAERGVVVLFYGISWAVVSVVASLFEEFAFRGYTQHTLAEGIGYWSAAEVLSAIFALAHLQGPVEGWTGAFVLLTVGLFWCLTLRRTGSLWFAVGMHASFKFGDTFLYSVSNIGPGYPVEGHLSSAILHGPAWLTGGAMGPEASVFRFLTVGILFLAIHKLYPAKTKDEDLAQNVTETSAKLDVLAEPKKGYVRSHGWRDLIFVCVGLALASWPKIGQYFNTNPVSSVSDFENWQARPKLDPVAVQTTGRRIDPCLFIVPPGASNQPVASGSIGECLMLVPDGRELDLYEVFLWSGNFIPVKTDLYVPDFMPLAFTRTHVVDSLARREHKYFRDVYEPHFHWDSEPYKLVEWYLPDGISIKYERNSSGPPDEHPIWKEVHYDTNAPLPLFKGSRVNWTGWAWDLSLQDGTTYLLEGERGSLVGIFDKNGNEIHLARKPNGDLTEITSPNGNWIRLSQDNGLLSRAADSIGNAVNYIYDERHRLKRVTDSRGQTTEYEYNLFNHIDRMTDSRGSNSLGISYAPHDRDNKVIQLSLPDGSKFKIDYFLDKETGAGHVDITDPKGNITRVTMNPKPGENDPIYTVEKLARNSSQERQR